MPTGFSYVTLDAYKMYFNFPVAAKKNKFYNLANSF